VHEHDGRGIVDLLDRSTMRSKPIENPTAGTS
jgi:hypothetical protein